VPDSLFVLHQARLADLAAKNRLPSMHGVRENVEAGAFCHMAPTFTDLYRLAVSYVNRILQGVKPADLPVEQPTNFEFVINLKTAKILGLKISPSFLGRTDRVIQ
jgi:putative ABC transport system substrate-binding protein